MKKKERNEKRSEAEREDMRSGEKVMSEESERTKL